MRGQIALDGRTAAARDELTDGADPKTGSVQANLPQLQVWDD